MSDDVEVKDEAQNERLPGKRSSKNSRYMFILVFVMIGMFGFAYANAKWFVIFCERIGVLSTSPTAVAVDGPGGERAPGHELKVYFSAYVNDDLPISFSVKNRTQKSNVNKWQTNDYRFTNLSNDTIYFKPVHDIFPTKAGIAETLELSRCFCFDLQKLEPRQSYSLPVTYLFNDTLGDDVKIIKMSYSLHPSTKEEYEASLAAKPKEAP